MNIYIQIEWTKRELDSNLLLGVLAAEKGADVFLLDYDSFEFLLKKNLIKPGILHSKSLVHDEKKQRFLENLKKSGFFITSIDEENGLVHNKNRLISFVKTRFTKEALQLVDAVFCWGNYDYEMLKENFKDYSKKFVLSGAPRVDLWKKKFDSYWNSSSKKIDKKYVVIASNFAVINSNIALWKIYYKLEKAGYFERNNDLKREFIEITAQSLKLFYKFVDAVNFLTQSCKDINFVVRPHPQESMDVWKYLLIKRDNLVIDNKEIISGVLKNSSALIHNGCTTAYEAALNDIPIISYHPLNEEVLHGKPANDLGMNVNNLDDLKKRVQDICSNNINKEDYCKKEIAKNKLNFNEDKISSNTIVDIWFSFLKDYKKKNNWNLIFLRLFIFQSVKRFIFNVLTIGKDKKKILGEEKFENKKKVYYQKKINKLKEILNITSDIHVNKSVNNTILIKKNDKS
jgi:surface carbohydrate biosynthesis protein